MTGYDNECPSRGNLPGMLRTVLLLASLLCGSLALAQDNPVLVGRVSKVSKVSDGDTITVRLSSLYQGMILPRRTCSDLFTTARASSPDNVTYFSSCFASASISGA